MKMTAPRPRPSLMLLWLTCALVLSACATTSPRATPTSCPRAQPAPSNVMRPPSAEKSLRAELFESGETPTTSSAPARPSSQPTVISPDE